MLCVMMQNVKCKCVYRNRNNTMNTGLHFLGDPPKTTGTSIESKSLFSVVQHINCPYHGPASDPPALIHFIFKIHISIRACTMSIYNHLTLIYVST